MKVFLSHASADKAFVEKVAGLLRPGTYELDSLTFEKGEMSVDLIISSLKRVDLFCLFMSASANLSEFVDLEKRLAIELIGAGKINSFLTICLDDVGFEKLTVNAKFFNAVRRINSPEAAAHLIKGKMISSGKFIDQLSHPFIGRENELKDLETQVLDFNRPKVKAFFVSGNSGVGRRSIMENFISRQYPQVLRSFPNFEIAANAGFDEIFRQVIAAIQPSLGIREYVEIVSKFSTKGRSEKVDDIASMLNRLLDDNLICFAFDAGGLLQESGALSPEIEEIINRLRDHPHPPLVMVSPRMTPRNFRRKSKDIAYLSVGALTREDAAKLAAWSMRTINANISGDQLNQLTDLSDLHPYNVYEMKDRIAEIGTEAFLADTSGFLAWKHKETSEYLREIEVSEVDRRILAVLLLAPELDFGSIADALQFKSDEIAISIQILVDLHVLSHSDDRFSISPPLRIAVERDPRVKLSKDDRSKIIQQLARSLTVLLEDGTAPVALADAAVLAALEAGDTISAVIDVLLLPSHRVWLAQRHYDAARWSDCLRLAQDAVKDKSRLSTQGFIAGCRLLCLSAARLNDQVVFEDGLNKLKSAAVNDWSKASAEFLKGFNARIRGRVIDAERFFKESFSLNGNDRSTARELASVCLITGDNAGAERFARKAYELATNNPYTIDILVSALIKTRGVKCVTDSEVNDLLDKLTYLDNEEHKSFSYTRRAEMELLYGDPNQASIHISEAIRRTPYLFEPKLLKARILLKQGRKAAVQDEIIYLERITSRHNQSENKANRRQVLLLKSEYLVETGEYRPARMVFEDELCFTDEDKAAETKKIDTIEGFARARAN